MAEIGALAFVLVGLVVTVLAVFTYVGAFHRSDVDIAKTSFRCLSIWYKFHVGQYANVGPCTEEMLRDFNLRKFPRKSVRLVFLYYDHPGNMRKKYGTDSFCRWCVGIALDDRERKAMTAVEVEKLERELSEKGYKPFVVRGGEVIRSSFPITFNRLFLSLNRTIRVQVVFPSLFKFIENEGIPVGPAAMDLCDGGKCETYIAVDQEVGKKWLVEEAEEMTPSKLFAELQHQLASEARRGAS